MQNVGLIQVGEGQKVVGIFELSPISVRKLNLVPRSWKCVTRQVKLQLDE